MDLNQKFITNNLVDLIHSKIIFNSLLFNLLINRIINIFLLKK